MGGRGASSGISKIKISIGGGPTGGRTEIFTQEQIDKFNSELKPNSSNKDVRDLFIKKYGDADVEYGMAYKNGKAISLSKGEGSSVYIKSQKGEGTIHNHPTRIGITGLGLSYADVNSGSIIGEKMTSITTQFNGKTVKQSIKYGKNFKVTEKEFMAKALEHKALIPGYEVPKGMTIEHVQKALFYRQDKWLSNIKNQKKFGYTYYSTLNKRR